MKRDLIKIFGEQRAENIKKYSIIQEEVLILKSTIFTEFNDEPIYITHTNTPSLNTNYNELKKLRTSNEGIFIEDKSECSEIHKTLLDDFFYEWEPINYFDLKFTDLHHKDVLGDTLLFSTNGIFKLINTWIDSSEKRMFYDDAILIEMK